MQQNEKLVMIRSKTTKKEYKTRKGR